ncbi:hypothetical protein AB0P15_15060 [Streptomyces sp. NPDC087917]|uniref:hypothetical protein n=1 Tax=unclassified Streptomyces TaxID=2593676 RepID=UPI0034359F29
MTPVLTKAAWDHPPTVIGYREMVVRRVFWLAVFWVPFLISVTCLGFGYARAAQPIFVVFLLLLSMPWVPWVAIAYVRRRRVAAILRAYPWRELPCHHPAQTSGGPATIAVSFDDSSTLFRTLPFRVYLARRSDGRPDRVWFAGHPLFGGVVSPVGGHYPVRVVAHVPRREPCGGPGFALALEVGLVRRSGKGTRT